MDNGASSYRRYLDGDDTGLIEIIKDYKDGLALYINGYVSNIFEAEDLMEEVFFRLAVKRPRFSGKSSFKTWIYTIARNVALDYLRSAVKTSVLSIEQYSEGVAEEANVEKQYLIKEQKIILHQAMRRLNGEYFRVLYLLYFEEFSNADAAVVLKKSKRQIENLVYRAKRALRTELDKEGFEYEKL